MLWDPSIPCSQSGQGALNGARTPAVPPHTVFLSRGVRRLVGFLEHPTGIDPAGPCPAPGRHSPGQVGVQGSAPLKCSGSPHSCTCPCRA